MHPMKILLSLLAAAAVFGLVNPSHAQADPFCHGSRRIVSYLRCGTPVYAIYQVIGYDRCGCPVGRWFTVQSPHRCGICNPHPSYGHGPTGCPPSSGFLGRSRPGFRFSFGFGR